ncbi:MAG: alpha/beta hydrolase fold domain-containing protein [Lysobacterales bacterium]
MERIESAVGEAGIPVLETVEVVAGPDTGSDPEVAVIWLHGLGADGHDFEPLVPELMWPGAPAIRFVFPHAPVRPVTINGGMSMRAWYDIVSLTSHRGGDHEGIAESVRAVSQLIEREESRGVNPARIVLAGFSQGGAIALRLALRRAEPLAGLIGLSTYLLDDEDPASAVHEANRDLPVFIGHGTHDPMVPLRLGEIAAERLAAMGYMVEWHSYPMPHAVCPQEIADLSAWLRDRFG